MVYPWVAPTEPFGAMKVNDPVGMLMPVNVSPVWSLKPLEDLLPGLVAELELDPLFGAAAAAGGRPAAAGGGLGGLRGCAAGGQRAGEHDRQGDRPAADGAGGASVLRAYARFPADGTRKNGRRPSAAEVYCTPAAVGAIAPARGTPEQSALSAGPLQLREQSLPVDSEKVKSGRTH